MKIILDLLDLGGTQLLEVRRNLFIASLLDPYEDAVAAIQQRIEVEDARLSLRLADRRLVIEQLSALRSAQKEVTRTEAEDKVFRERFDRLSKGKESSDLVIELGKELANQARERRTAIVSRVFNENLNKMWRDLFVRLAPEEPFVPAFAVPEVSTGPVEAVLETRYRRGGKEETLGPCSVPATLIQLH